MQDREKKLLKLSKCLLEKLYSGKVVKELDVENCLKKAGFDKVESNQLFKQRETSKKKKIRFDIEQEELF